MRNVSECTAIDGYFIGTCYDGRAVFNYLKDVSVGESKSIYSNGEKIWEIEKDYSHNVFDSDSSCMGYKISVYQESINSKKIPEYLVNFDYLVRVMENYGFRVLTVEEVKRLNLPNGSGMFNEFYNFVLTKKIPSFKSIKMTNEEKTISFLNRYFVFKKVSNVDTAKVVLEDEEKQEQEKEVNEKDNNPDLPLPKEKITIKIKRKKVKATNEDNAVNAVNADVYPVIKPVKKIKKKFVLNPVEPDPVVPIVDVPVEPVEPDPVVPIVVVTDDVVVNNNKCSDKIVEKCKSQDKVCNPTTGRCITPKKIKNKKI
jgi:hypothetical protein